MPWMALTRGSTDKKLDQLDVCYKISAILIAHENLSVGKVIVPGPPGAENPLHVYYHSLEGNWIRMHQVDL